ncbi:unnamed protein product [Effrenium voratum]|nr:unnamed protein product [Effrenium voratum]
MVVMSPSVSASMVEPERFTAAVTLAITYFTANYLLLSFCGDFLYSYVAGDVVAQEVTLSKAFSVTPIHSAAVVIYVLQLLLTFPSGLFMMFRNAEKLCASRASWQRRARRVVLILSFCGVAMILPRFADFLAVRLHPSSPCLPEPVPQGLLERKCLSHSIFLAGGAHFRRVLWRLGL